MKIEIATNEKNKQIRELWELVFSDDSQEYLDFYFDVVTKKNVVITVTENNVLVGMLHLNPYDVKGLSSGIYYIVGVATHPDYRRKGIMRQMLEFAHKYAADNGKEVLLLPEDERYYKPFGYVFVSKQYNTTIKSMSYRNMIFTENVLVEELDIDAFTNWFKEHRYIEKDFEAIHHTKYLQSLYKEITCEDGKVISINGNLVLYYLKDVLEVRKFYLCSQEENELKIIVSELLRMAECKDLVFHEVNEKSLSKVFSYSRTNNYDCRPYMMRLTTKEVGKFIYFDEVV